jgi:prepilin peptidase CpaA
MGIEYMLLAIFLCLAFYTDIKRTKIPNILTVSGAFAGLGYHFIYKGTDGIFFSFLGLIVGFGVFFLLYLFGAVGAGDVKLFGAIGALTGIEFVLYSSMYSILYAGLIGIVIVLIKKEFVTRIVHLFKHLFYLLLLKDIKSISSIKKSESYRFPFMYAVLPGVITCYYYFFIV